MASISEESSQAETKLRNEVENLERRQAELQNQLHKTLKTEISRLTKDLHDRIQSMASISEESSQAETKLRNEVENLERRQAELQQENRQLRDDLACLREEMIEMEEEFEEQLQLALRDLEISAQTMRSKDDRRFQRVEEDSQRKLQTLQERLDSTVQRYEEEVSYLRNQKARLEEQLDMERNSNYSQPINGMDHYDVEMGRSRANGDGEVHHEGDSSFDTVLSSQAMSSSESDDYGNTAEPNLENFPNSVSEGFLAAEIPSAMELERLIDSHIAQFKIGAEATLRKYNNVKRRCISDV